ISIWKLCSPDAVSATSGCGSTGSSIGRPCPDEAVTGKAASSIAARKIRRTCRTIGASSAGPSVGNRQRSHIGIDFGSHKALLAAPEAHQDDLAGPQLRHAVAAQRLHVDENVLGALAA